MNIKSAILLLAALPALCSAEVITLRLYEGRSADDAQAKVLFSANMLITSDQPSKAETITGTTYLKSAQLDTATQILTLTPGLVEHGTRAEIQADSKTSSLYHISLTHKNLMSLRDFTIKGSDQRLQTPFIHENSMVQHAMLVDGQEINVGAFDYEQDPATPVFSGAPKRLYYRITATLHTADKAIASIK